MAHQVAFTITLAVVAVVFVNASDIESKALEECNKNIKAPPSALTRIRNLENLDSSKEGKCLVQCVMEAFGVMREDGFIDPENSMKYVTYAYSKAVNHKKVYTLWDNCQKKVEKVEDKCEHAFGLLSCFVDGAKKGNFPKLHSDKN